MAALSEPQRSRSPQISQREETVLHKPNITVSNVSTGSRKTHLGVIPFLYSFDLLLDSYQLPVEVFFPLQLKGDKQT